MTAGASAPVTTYLDAVELRHRQRPSDIRNTQCQAVSSPWKAGRARGSPPRPRSLAERLGGLGIAVVKTREPGGSPGAEIVRDIVLSGLAKPFGLAGGDPAVRRRPPRPSRQPDQARARRRQMGDLRPLHRFHPGVPGDSRASRPPAGAGARTDYGRRCHARSHRHPRPAGRDRARPRPRPACAAAPPTGSRARTSAFTSGSMRRSARSRRRSPDAAW